MKPRLESLNLTPEDLDIWRHIGNLAQPDRKYFGNLLAGVSYHGDRRDADLMWKLELTRLAVADYKPKDYQGCLVYAIMLGRLQETGQVSFP
jgi:hypothetical protein